MCAILLIVVFSSGCLENTGTLYLTVFIKDDEKGTVEVYIDNKKVDSFSKDDCVDTGYGAYRYDNKYTESDVGKHTIYQIHG